MKLELTNEELQALKGILLTEKSELQDLIQKSDEATTKELLEQKALVESMLNKIK